jgi:hypothetical protein
MCFTARRWRRSTVSVVEAEMALDLAESCEENLQLLVSLLVSGLIDFCSLFSFLHHCVIVVLVNWYRLLNELQGDQSSSRFFRGYL